jgi:hypothetical protein
MHLFAFSRHRRSPISETTFNFNNSIAGFGTMPKIPFIPVFIDLRFSLLICVIWTFNPTLAPNQSSLSPRSEDAYATKPSVHFLLCNDAR